MNPDESRVDQALLGQAQQVLGTATPADTLELALSIAIKQARHTEAVAGELARFQAGRYTALPERATGLPGGGLSLPERGLGLPERGLGLPDPSPAGHLIDTSALAQSAHPAVSGLLHALLQARSASTCPVIELEVLAIARSSAEYDEIAAARRLAYRVLPLSTAIGTRMAELGALLSRASHRSAATPADLLVAATAMEHGLRLIHQRPAFSLLGELTTLDQVPVLDDAR